MRLRPALVALAIAPLRGPGVCGSNACTHVSNGKLKEAITSLFTSAGLAAEAEQISAVSRTSDTVQRAFAIKLRFKRNEALESCLMQASKLHPDSWKDNPMGSTEQDFYNRLTNIHSHVLKKATDGAKESSQPTPHMHNRGYIFLRREARPAVAPHLLQFLTTLHNNHQRQAKGSGSNGGGRGGGRGHRSQSAAPVDTFK